MTDNSELVKRILVAVDGSESSNKAVGMAAAISRDLRADLVILHVVEMDEFPTLIAEAQDESKGEMGEIILADAIKLARLSGVEPKPKLLMGHAVGQILRFAEEYSPQMIFLGSHGRSPERKLFMGGVSEAVSRKAKVSVVIVR
jgi:nucleotide-binding universal stress UspA family protein